MGENVRNADISGDAGVAAAQGRLDAVQTDWVEIGKEAGLLAASSSPVGGQIADGISLASNLASGNYGGALVDAIGFIPFGGDLIKGAVRGTSIARKMKRIDDALDAARTGLSRAQEFARRRQAANKYWAAIKARREAIIKKYEGCKVKKCRDWENKRDKELEAETKLPSREKGDWVDEHGKRAPAGQGVYKPKKGTDLHDALQAHQKPVTGIPYVDGKPDLSGFPPPGRNNADINGGIYKVEIDQNINSSLDVDKRRELDRNNTWGQWRRDYPDRPEPSGGRWHHDADGTTIPMASPCNTWIVIFTITCLIKGVYQ